METFIFSPINLRLLIVSLLVRETNEMETVNNININDATLESLLVRETNEMETLRSERSTQH